MSETPNADRIQQHRAKATELREKAVKMNTSDARQQLLDIAREYEALADAIERRLSRT